MSDAERGSETVSVVAAYPKRGASIHGVEGAILGVVALAWCMIRLQLSATCLADEVILLCYFLASILNLLGSTLVSDRDLVQGAYFGFCLCLWVAYLYLIVESLLVTGATGVGPNPFARVFFGSMQLYQATAGVSLALATLTTLLAAGAVSQRLWEQTLWMDALVLFLSGIQAGLCKSGGVVFLDVVGVALLGAPVVTGWAWLFESFLWRAGHFLFFLLTAVVGVVVAWSNQTTTVGLPAFLAVLIVLMLIRFLQPLPPIDYASSSQVPETESIPIPPAAIPADTDPPPSAPDMLQRAQARFLTPVTFGGQMPRALFVPAESAARHVSSEMLLFGRVSRPPLSGRISKKTL